jgi:hypothetical protein
MPSAAPDTVGLPGPWAWRNARALIAGKSSWGTLEIACYTDLSSFALQIHEISGPYSILTPIDKYDRSFRIPRLPRMGLVLRIEQYLDHDPDEYIDRKWEEANAAIIPGGDGGDELAALISLILGIRLQSAGISRYFIPGDDPKGHPCETNPPPYLPRLIGSATLLPYTGDDLYTKNRREAVNSEKVRLLDAYSRLTARQANALLTSARAYQEAIWIADGDPRQAWLRLVTAVEAVAQLIPDIPEQARLRNADPDIYELISRTGNPELLARVTTRVADQSRSTAKFLEFIRTFGPGPPRRRPKYGRLEWKNVRKQLNQIYKFRSRDLHQGIPFPQQMCQPPGGLGNAQEIIAVIDGKPQMSLHTFEYIVRNSLQSWWREQSNIS